MATVGGADDAEAAGRRRIGRSASVGACSMGAVFAAKIAPASWSAGFAWWIAAPRSLLFGAGGAVAGTRTGRMEGTREEALLPGRSC
ncbi:hypothetical protein [Streptomyces sp. NPDC054838]